MEQLNGLFGKPQSVWIDRYECLRAMKLEDEEFSTFVNRNKRLLRDFDFKQLKEEHFNSLMLLIALKSPSEAALRSRFLAKLAADGDKIKYDKVGKREPKEPIVPQMLAMRRHVKTVCRKCNKTGHMETNAVRLGKISLVTKGNQQRLLIEIPTFVNGKEVKFLMDSGAEVSVLNEETHCLIGKPLYATAVSEHNN
uniref:Peptidase A2 domain-containing protein n=1 Tax=Globodera pallida TaxID=36090 RepID=A0A183CFL5_GLOPA